MIYDIKENTVSDKFDDLFEKNRKLGEGANTTIYECVEKKTGKKVAVKIWKNRDEDIVRDIKQSFLLLKQLNHPYLLKAHELYIDSANSRCYMVSDVCQFHDLRHFLEEKAAKQETISEEQAADIVGKLISCLKYMKERGVCHRDIKPENILYDPATGDLRLIDFELSKMKKYKKDYLDLWTKTGSLFYRAPESFSFGYDESVDMWAAGVVLFELLTGKLPFENDSVKDVTDEIKSKSIDYDALSISKQAKRMLKAMLEKNPAQRLTPE